MRYWVDTEFIDARPSVHLISIGIVAEDGREYYAENRDWPRQQASQWIKENVVPHLTDEWKTPELITKEIEVFLGDDPEIWLWYGAYDWVALTQLWGRMVDAPQWALNCYYNELRQLVEHYELHVEAPPKPENAHNALADARWTRDYHRIIEEVRHRPLIHRMGR